MELDELLINAINDRESYPSESTAKRAMWLDEVISKSQDEIYKRCHTEDSLFLMYSTRNWRDLDRASILLR